MDIMINRRRKKKELEGVSELQLGDNTGSNIKNDKDMPLEILRMKDNDPRLLKFMEEVDERFKEKFGRITHGELFKIQELATKARKQNPHLKFNEAVDIVFEKIAFKKRV